jgi:glycosyltransferase involved in cell wall biosynthesis
MPDQDNSNILKPIKERYLLALTGLPFYVDLQGRRYLTLSWVKDLKEHLKYLINFTLAAPCSQQKPAEEIVALDTEPLFNNVKFIDLPWSKSNAEWLLKLPQMLRMLWQATGNADIIHTSLSAYPIPDAWLITPITRLRKRFQIIVVESAFWRPAAGIKYSLKARIKFRVWENLNRWCVNHSDIAFFTQEEYRRSLLTRKGKRGYVINASWIDEKAIIADHDAAMAWEQKLAAFEQLKILFAGRLVLDKGIRVLIEAMRLLDAERMSISLDILGKGELVKECEKAMEELKTSVRISILGTVPYGPKLYDLIKGYHLLVVPSLTDEQPRIIYDAYSQGIPIIAADTPGNRDCVRNGETGKLVPINNAFALAEAIQWAWRNPDVLAKMGLTSLKMARSLTHQEMHQRRWRILSAALSGS